MDPLLIEYLLSGKAWLFIGSGPSIEMGYPSWGKLASIAAKEAETEHTEADLTKLNAALSKHDYPAAFKEAEDILGGPRLLQILRTNLKPTSPSKMYEMFATWPIPVYLTTNYDDELQYHLSHLQLAYITYSNSEDHMSQLLPDFSGAIMKLHGDLSSQDGLILTANHYKEITEASSWEYWRSKMTAVFQMNRVIVIGHSLSDRNMKHVLQAAKKGAGVAQPVIWIAPNVPVKDRRELLEDYRIRVVTYEDRDGQHRNLARLIESLSEFVPPRTVVQVQEQIEKLTRLSLQPHAAAPGFFVFNEVCRQIDFEQKRIDIVLSAIQAALPEINDLGHFTFEKALAIAGWPEGVRVDADFMSNIREQAVQREFFSPLGEEFQVTDNALTTALKKRKTFEHMRGRFQKSILLRIKRDFTDLTDTQAAQIPVDIESSLTEYFREGGLSLASALFSSRPTKTAPSSIIPFITAASTRYDHLTMRQAFFKASVDAFMHPESAEREYLGRISQGFFAFHSLGVFGDAAFERLKLAGETVWLLDSDTQIRVLALGAPANAAYRECLSRLTNIGLRFFTPTSLLDETREHLWFANNVIKQNEPNSPYVIAAARGEPPFRKSNLFLEGFIRWQDAGNPCNWGRYLYDIFESSNYPDIDIKNTLNTIGIEAVELQEWPGFHEQHFHDVDQYAINIATIYEQAQPKWIAPDSDLPTEAFKKAKPEAEAYHIVQKEREGEYYIISEQRQESPAWFISYTSILNLLAPEQNTMITWQPEAFLSFASTLCDLSQPELVEHAFGTILLGLAQSGLNLLDDDTIARVFGAGIDQAKLNIEALRQEYRDVLQSKYGEPLDHLLARISPPYYQLAAIQLATEIAEAEAERRRHAELEARRAAKLAESSEKRLQQLEKFRIKLLRKQSRPPKTRKSRRKRKKK